jgi:hypothetical protein
MNFYNQNYTDNAQIKIKNMCIFGKICTLITSSLVHIWENMHIDHIMPVSRFDLDNEDDFLACCHHTNLQLLLPQDNLQKLNPHEKYWKENTRNDSNYLGIYLLERALFI